MSKKIIGFLLVIICLFSVIGCNVVDPQATMKIPNVVGQGDVKKSNKIMSKVNEFLPEDTEILEISSITGIVGNWFEADLTGDGYKEILLGYQDKDNKTGVIVLEKQEGNLKKIYEETFETESADLQFDKVLDMRTVKLINNDMTQVVISYNYYGADHNSLSIQVLGYDPEKRSIKNHLSLTDIPNAELDVKKESLIVKAMGVNKEYRWDGSELISEQLFLQPNINSDDVVIHYAMSKEGPLTISMSEVNLKVGQRLVFVRDDKLNEQERIMQSGDDLDFVDILDATSNKIYTAQKPGILTMIIVPNGGYDWDNAKEIKVTVEE